MEKETNKFKNEEISIGGMKRSFGHAFRGLFILSIKEKNVRIQVVIAVIVILLGFYFHISIFEWMFIILAIVGVVLAELFNTATEIILDLLHPEFSEKVKDAKDLSAGAVLFAVIGAVVIGVIVLGKR